MPCRSCTLIGAHKDLEKLVLTRHELSFKSKVEEEWSWLVYSGLWMEPSRLALDAFVNTTQQRVNGTVRAKFYKGGMRIVGRKSEDSLYQHKLSTYDHTSTFDQNAAVGFIELVGASIKGRERKNFRDWQEEKGASPGRKGSQPKEEMMLRNSHHRISAKLYLQLEGELVHDKDINSGIGIEI